MSDLDRKKTNDKKVEELEPLSKKKLAIVGCIAVFIAIIVFGFKIRTLEIQGNERVSDDEIKQLVHYQASHGNSIMLWGTNRKVDVSSNVLLSSISVVMKSPTTICIKVQEEPLVACMQVGNDYAYLNNNGKIILYENERSKETAWITSLVVEQANVGEKIKTTDEGALDAMLEIASNLKKYSLSVDNIESLPNGSYAVRMSNIYVLLGRRMYVEEKISELKALKDEIDSRGLTGTLHLENYDSTKDSIIFTKD